MSHLSTRFVGLYKCFGFDFCYLVYLNVGSVMDASKRMILAKAMKAARAAKAGASSAPAADPNPSSTLPPPPPTTTEAPLGSSSPSPHSPEALQTPGSPPPIAAVPLGAWRLYPIISDDEDSGGVAPFKRRKAARVPLLPAASPQGEDSFRDNPPSATSLPPQWSKRKQTKVPNLLHPRHRQRSLLLPPPLSPPPILLPSLLQLCI